MESSPHINPESGATSLIISLKSPWLWLVLLVYFLLGFFRLDYKSLWIDDAFSILGSALPFQTGTLHELDRARPLYFWLLGTWSLFGESDLYLRSLTVLIGGAAVSALYLFSARVYGRRTAFFAALFLATSGSYIFFAQQIRFYTLLIFFAVVQMWALYALLESRSYKSLSIYFATVLLGLMSNPPLALLNLAQAFYVLLFYWRDKKLLMRYVVSGIIVTALFSPYVLHIWAEASRFQKGWISFIDMPSLLHPAGSLKQVARTVVSVPEHHAAGSYIGAVLLVLCAASLAYARKTGARQVAMPIIWIFLPLIILLVTTDLGMKIFHRKTLFLILPGTAIALAIIASRSRVWTTALLLLAYLVCNGYYLYHYYRADNIHGEDWKSTVAYLESPSVYSPDMPVYIFPHSAKYVFNHYAAKPHRLVPVNKLRPLKEIKDHFDSIFAEQDRFVVIIKRNNHIPRIIDQYLYKFDNCRDSRMFDLIKIIEVRACTKDEKDHCGKNRCVFRQGSPLMRPDLNYITAKWSEGRQNIRWSAGPGCGAQQGAWEAGHKEKGPVPWNKSRKRLGWYDPDPENICGGHSPWFMLEGPNRPEALYNTIHFKCDAKGEAYKIELFSKSGCEILIAWD